jgi:hypothetical protein
LSWWEDDWRCEVGLYWLLRGIRASAHRPQCGWWHHAVCERLAIRYAVWRCW